MNRILSSSGVFINIDIKHLKIGDELVNLGKVLEIEILPNKFSVVIYRLNQKQVFFFNSDDILIIYAA
ncbi:hypothetical protein [Pedobacter duraquae]|uniref:Uncharacterized protein n=1 Tax=Pedobacter duraquae TaxID=425511 RepID=A0A4V3C374_9SPHI|nr:hypothetical protein [Pedobacter duraquae]TDO20919.1 hypothetical protein CLV32_3555 [Pedobacter duraquae]